MSIVSYNYLDQHDIDIDYQHNHDDNQHCAADNNNHDLEQHILNHDNNHNRATMHRLMHVAMARRIAEMDQDLWR
jgi:hypothetical protein